MSKKLITACLALVALAAFALPASASASPELGETVEGAFSKLAVGSKITGTNVNGTTKFLNDEGTGVLAECEKAVMTGEVTSNTGTHIAGNITTATFYGGGEGELFKMQECDGTFGDLTPTTNSGTDTENVTNGTPWCITTNGKDEFTVRGAKCSEEQRAITFVLDTTLLFGGTTECKYSRSEAIKGTYTTHPEDAVFTLKGGANTTFKGEAGNNFVCPATGSLEMSFTLETDSASVVPLYVR